VDKENIILLNGIFVSLLIVNKQGTIGFLNTDTRLIPVLVMHAARTLEKGTNLNCASILRHVLELVAVQVISMLSLLSKLWCPLLSRIL
jgi:hypothetical protein